MAKRQYFKDLTAGEIQWIKVSASQVAVDGTRLQSPSYLGYRPDGTTGFDEFSTKQRATLFAILDSPNVRSITSQYDRLYQGIAMGRNPPDSEYYNANRALLDLRDQIPFDALPLPRSKDENNLNLEDEIVQQRIADVVTKIKFNAGTPEVDPGDLTEADRAIVIDPNSPNTSVATQLTPAEAKAAGIQGYELIELVTSPAKPLVVSGVETAAAVRQTDYNRVLARQDVAINTAADILALTPAERAGGLRIVKVTDSVIDGNKTITATDQFGTQRVLNRDEFNQTKTNFLKIAEEEENQLRYFKSWAEERGVSQDEIQAVFAVNTTGPDGIAKLAANKDYQDNLTAYKALNNGQLPFATPATDAQLAYSETDLAKSIAAENARRLPVGGAVADKIESTGGADTATALSASETARLKIAADNDTLKREAIKNGTPPIATPTVASQSAVVAVDTSTADTKWGSPVDLNSTENNKLTKQITDAFSASTANDTMEIQTNPLDQYDSYTYGIALHVLTKDEYDRLGQNAKQWNPAHTLIASAGRWQESNGAGGNADYMKRQPGWEDNFYFDNLKMTQLQSPSTTGRSTNTIEIEFTIVEPYGLTLLDRLITTANALQQVSYLHLCYMLQIDFFDAQKGLLTEHRKYFPITLTGMNIKVSGKGTQYVVSAFPFHYKALMQTISTTPLDVDVVSTTLRDFFADDNVNDSDIGGTAAVALYRREQEALDKAANPAIEGQVPAGVRVATAAPSNSDKNYVVHSYTSVYNGWWKKMKELNAVDPKLEPQNIKVRFADEIIKGEKLTKPVDAVAADGPMAKPDAKQGVAVVEKPKYSGFGFKAGTNIIEVINTTMMSCEFIRSQVRLAGQEENASGNLIGTVNWWKILPQVTLNGFDNTLNRWSYSVIYFVVPYKIWNTKHPNLPKSSPRRANCVKQYNYLYTGDNRSVIDFQVEFDMLYFTTVAGFKQINTARADRPEPGPDQAGKDSNNRGPDSNNIAPVVHNLVPHDASNSTGNNLTQDARSVALGTIQDSIYSGANGEMLTVNMKIIGDPTLIKQDDLFINIGEYYDPNARNATSDGIRLADSHHASGAAPALSNNSIVTDAGEVLAWVQILMPPDIDELTGGLRLASGASSVNSFTGVYKIMEVQNEFSQGKFVQTLVLIRYQQQEADDAYRKRLEEERKRIKNNDAGITLENLARNADSADDEAEPDINIQSAQVATNSGAAGTDETILTQTASAVVPPAQLNLLDTGNFPESVIAQTDLA
jgi:hypothetical protein